MCMEDGGCRYEGAMSLPPLLPWDLLQGHLLCKGPPMPAPPGGSPRPMFPFAEVQQVAGCSVLVCRARRLARHQQLHVPGRSTHPKESETHFCGLLYTRACVKCFGVCRGWGPRNKNNKKKLQNLKHWATSLSSARCFQRGAFPIKP